MQAETLNCPMCGAATTTDAPRCRYCEARLATVACPSCFAMMFLGSKHCQRCGAAATRDDAVVEAGKECPRCRTAMNIVAVGETKMLECASCLGLWLNTTTFERICADREQQAAVLGSASLNGPIPAAEQTSIRYVPCPECSELMNRANFARCSGVIVDLCKRHGLWFDRDELSRIIEFIRGGGLEASRAKEKADLEDERRRLRQEQLAVPIDSSGRGFHESSEAKFLGIASAGSLLDFLLS